MQGLPASKNCPRCEWCCSAKSFRDTGYLASEVFGLPQPHLTRRTHNLLLTCITIHLTKDRLSLEQVNQG